MKVVIQRVIKASVTISNKKVAEIANGLLLLLGIESEDSQQDIDWITNKIVNMRIFNDENFAMNKSLLDVDGQLLLVSQFTLYASTKKGNRPSFIKAAKPDVAFSLYQNCINKFEEIMCKKIETGQFGADMKVELINDGPVTIIIDSKDKK